MTARYQGEYRIDDGYAGKARPQHFTVNADELGDDMTDADLITLYEDLALEAFQNDIRHYTVRREEFVAWARERLQARKEDDEG